MQFAISTYELQSLYSKRNNDLLVVDTRPYSVYSEGHLPNAINTELAHFHWIDTSREGVSQFNKQMRMLLSNIGITKNKLVVFYDDMSGIYSARGVWLLLYFSHNKTAMLDGGFNKWKKEGLQIETNDNPFTHSSFRGNVNPQVLAGFDYLKYKIKDLSKRNNDVVLIDSRTKAEYDGTKIRAAKSGHIPSSENIDWLENVKKDGTFKEAKKLEKLYSHIPKNKEVITYCHGGYRAANTFVVLRNLGYKKVRMYIGSWGEWGNKQGLPIER